jgi:hypothetical protein
MVDCRMQDMGCRGGSRLEVFEYHQYMGRNESKEWYDITRKH